MVTQHVLASLQYEYVNPNGCRVDSCLRKVVILYRGDFLAQSLLPQEARRKN
jgi:hypothetical protein